MLIRSFSLLALLAAVSDAFVLSKGQSKVRAFAVSPRSVEEADTAVATAVVDIEDKRRQAKAALLGLINDDTGSNTKDNIDPILVDPVTKDELRIVTTSGIKLGGQNPSGGGSKVSLISKDNVYTGRTNTYYNLLREQEKEEGEDGSSNEQNGIVSNAFNTLQVFIPPPLRPVLSATGVLPGYIPMRDLFTSPSVSFAYERGWRQGFASAGFPGADKEYEMVREFFMPVNPKVVVDMSCATGLFTRRLTKGNDFERVIGCDYSEAMLLEARNRINSDPEFAMDSSVKTKLDLIRCDVGEIPMKSDSIDCLHAGAAMHCWPDLENAMLEIHRVLKPQGRFFASTFLAPYFRTVKAVGGDGIEQQAFQYFESVDQLKEIVMKGGFEKVEIEVLGQACAIIRAYKE